MLAVERHRRLLGLIQREGVVRTVDAARSLGVAEETVRRDLEKLEREGSLIRSHGGAVRAEPVRVDLPARERARRNIAAKRRIAAAALREVRAGETIFLDASTTVLELARLMTTQPVTVLTTSLEVALVLTEHPSVRLVLLGGEVTRGSMACVGWPAEAALEGFRVDAAFVSCRGWDLERGASEASEEQARLKRRVVRHAGRTALLADASKTATQSGYFFARPAEIDLWITERSPGPDARGVRVVVARSS